MSNRKNYYNEYYRKNREKILAIRKKYRDENKERILEIRRKHYQKNREEILNRQRERNKGYYQKHREKEYKRQKIYREKNREKVRSWQKKWRNKNRDKVIKYYSERGQKLKLEVLTHYGGNPPKCACCGKTEIRFLTIDHIKNDGNSQRKIHGTSYDFYRWLKRNDFSEGFQVLCMNCNWGKARNNGICPHKERGN